MPFSRQIDDMFNAFQMQMSTMTKQTLERIDQIYASVGIQQQNLYSGDHISPTVTRNVRTNNPNSQTVASTQNNVNLMANQQNNSDNTIYSNTNLLKTNGNDGSNYPSSVMSSGPSMMNNVDVAPVPLSVSKFPNQYHGSSVKLKPQIYDGKEDLDEYLSQFEILADLNSWNYEAKSLYLAGSLKGDARTLLTELSPEQRRDYDSLVKILNLRFGSFNRAEIYKANLQTRTKRRDETISESSQSIKKLTRQAYPNAPYSITSTLARDHFIDALPESDMRLRLREAQAKDIAEAEILALRLEAYRVADRQKSNRKNVQFANQIGINSTGDVPENETVVKSIVDGFRPEFQALANDIKQVVKNQQKPEKDKNNAFRPNPGNHSFQNRQYNGHQKNNVSQNPQYNNGRQNNNGFHNPQYNGRQNNGHQNSNYNGQNGRFNNQRRNQNPVQQVQENLTVSNTGASVRQNPQGPQ